MFNSNPMIPQYLKLVEYSKDIDIYVSPLNFLLASWDGHLSYTMACRILLIPKLETT